MPLKLCIDAGHGRSNRSIGVYDPGAVSRTGLTEADIALDWALTLKWVCAKEGVEFFLTRDDDSDNAPVGQRDEKAELAGCTHFLSIHCNAAGSYNGTGVESFYRDKRDEQLAKLALDSVLEVPGCPETRGVKHERLTHHGRLAIMDFDGPCTILEIGFITRPSDVKFMVSRNSRLTFAMIFVRKLKEFYGQQ